MPIGQNDLLQGTLQILILKALLAESTHGYGIARWIEQTTGDVLRIEEGSLYPALQRMLLKGWVTAQWGVTAGNRRARYYTLTADGRKRLHVEVSQFERVMGAIVRVIQTV